MNKTNKIYISEIFGSTIQGEGARAGRLSLFIRVGLCNFSCAGFGVEYKINDTTNQNIKFGCDSYYSVDKTFKKEWQKLSSNQILKQLYKLNNSKNIDIVITGGEPLIYWQNKEFQRLLKKLNKNNHFITIETNGSIPIKINKKYQKNIMFSIGLKLSNSGENKSARLNYDALNILLQNKNSYIKIVTDGNKSDIKEILEIKSNIKSPIYLMPLCSTKEELEKVSKKVVKQAIKYNLNYSDRLHIRLWGDKRGV